MNLFTRATRAAKNLRHDTSGAVTVDWVVLTALLVGISVGVVTVISKGLNSATASIETELNNAVQTGKTLK